MTDKQTKEMIKRHEGYRNKVYMDSVGVPTGGYGHAFLQGSSLPNRIWEQIFEEDYKIALNDYDRFTSIYELNLDEVRRGVIIDMLFNLGLTKLMRFKRLIRGLQTKDWDLAARSMKESLWYKQVGSRAIELINIIKTGSFIR